MAACRLLVILLALVGDVMGARIQPSNSMTKRRIAEANLNNAGGAKGAKASPRHYKRASAKSIQQHKETAQAPVLAEVKQESSKSSPSLPTSFIQSETSRTFEAVLSVLPKSARNQSERTLLGLAVFGFVVMVMLGAFCVSHCCFNRDKKGKQLRNDFLTSPPSSSTSFEEPQLPRKQHFHQGRVVYEWSQSEAMVNVFIKVPEGTNRHDLDIKISSKELQVGKVEKPAFMTEDMYDVITQEQSGWRLRSNGELQIHLAKKDPSTWPCAFLSAQDQGEEA